MQKSKLIQPRESEIQNSIIEYLRLKKFYVQRLNSGMIPLAYKGKTRMMNLSEPGTPDLMAFKNEIFIAEELKIEELEAKPNERIIMKPITYKMLQLYFIEIKRPGKTATKLQAEKMLELEKYGASCLEIHSIEELQKAGL